MRNEGGGRVDELVENIRGWWLSVSPAEIAAGVKAQQKQLNSTTSTTSTSTVRHLE
jgi:hypothetical protein